MEAGLLTDQLAPVSAEYNPRRRVRFLNLDYNYAGGSQDPIVGYGEVTAHRFQERFKKIQREK